MHCSEQPGFMASRAVTSVSGKGCHRDRKGRACHVLAAALAAVICVGTGLLPAPQAALSPAHLELVLEADTTPPLVGEPLGIRLRVVNRGSNEIEGDFYPRYALDHVRIAISKDRAEAIPYVSMAMKLAAAKKIGAEPVTIAASGFVERKETIAFDVARDTSAFSAARGLSNARFPLL